MAETFIVPKEPELHWKMLLPNFQHNESFFRHSGRPVHYLFWARNGIYHGLAALGVKPGDNVLVPAYHCSSLVEPILRYGSNVKFYDINVDLTTNFDDVKAKVDRKTRAILAIHYFGFPQPIRKFSELCQARGLYLIEDCAHVFAGKTQDEIVLGDSGDISVFSWRKFLPLYDGGYLVLNNPTLRLEIPSDKYGLLFSMKVAKNIFDKLIDDSEVKFLSHIFRFPYWLARRFLRTNGSELNVLDINNRSLDFDMSLVNLKMSGLSKCILRNIDLSGVFEKRRVNYNYLLRALGSLPGITPAFGELSAGLCPWVFPILVNSHENFHLTLRSKGIPATTWGGVIHPQIDLDKFPDAAFLYQNLVLLPVHQDLEEADLRRMVEIFSDALVEGNSSSEYQLAAGGTL